MKTKKFDQLRVNKVLDYISASNDYTLEGYLKEKNLLQNMTVQGSQFKISCPYHSDSSPSMSIDLKTDTFNCLSGCGHSGGYINFIVQYSNEKEGLRTNFYRVLDDFVRTDKTMQSVLGFNTIFIVHEFKDIKSLVNRKPVHLKELKPNSYSELHSMLGKLDKKDILRLIGLIQDGLPPAEVYETMTYIDVQDNIFNKILNTGGGNNA